MVIALFVPSFVHDVKKIKDKSVKLHLHKQIEKILENPLVGKPMRYERVGTREVYVGQLRLAYRYSEIENTVQFLQIYHKDRQ